MVEHFLIVAAHKPKIYHLLSRQFAGSQKVRVLLDQRQRERRRQSGTPAIERRWVDRRQNNPPRSDWFQIIRRQTPPLSRLLAPLWAQEKTTRRTETSVDFDLWGRTARLVGVMFLALGVLLTAFMGTTISLSVFFNR